MTTSSRLSQVRQLQRVEATGEWRAYVLGLELIGDVSSPFASTLVRWGYHSTPTVSRSEASAR